jgi:hypothetical protein
MASRERIYHGSVRALSALMIGLGVVIIATTLAGGGGPLSLGMMLGAAFVVVGAGRLWLVSRTKQ